MQMLKFSNGVMIDSAEILWIESNQQRIEFPGQIGELTHMLKGQPAGLLIRLRDGSVAEINAGAKRLGIQIIND